MNLDTQLLRLSSRDAFTLRDACQGVCITGSIGGGKTSGSGQALASAYLRAGMGGIVLVAKPEEAVLWRSYAAANGRSESLIEFDGKAHGFNFLAYELGRQGLSGLNSIVECLFRVIEAARAASASPGRPGEVFWEETIRQILRNSIPIIHAATGTVTVPDILAFIRGAPRSPEELTSEAWKSRSAMFRMFAHAERRIDPALGRKAVAYWRDDFAILDAKLRGNILISLTTVLDRFNHGWLQHAFCGETTVVPDLCFSGAIILLNMPALTLNEDGIIAQQIFKYMWQRAVLARNALAPRFRERPLFMWADEAQYFLDSSSDAEFLSTCRGSRVCSVFLSQSLPTYYAKIGGENARDKVHHLLGNMATKVFHSNACPETNEWAARTLGRTVQKRNSFNESEGDSTNFGMNRGQNTNRGSQSSTGSSYGRHGGGGTSSHGSSTGNGENWGDNRGRTSNRNTSWGYTEQVDYLIEPASFGRILMTGGPANNNQVSAVWYQAGRTFKASRGNSLLTVFRQ